MAEALGVASSVVSFVSLAGQVAQGVNYLLNYFDSTKDAPDDFNHLPRSSRCFGRFCWRSVAMELILGH